MSQSIVVVSNDDSEIGSGCPHLRQALVDEASKQADGWPGRQAGSISPRNERSLVVVNSSRSYSPTTLEQSANGCCSTLYALLYLLFSVRAFKGAKLLFEAPTPVLRSVRLSV